ncbi:AAEL003337-PA [Aedes aegypti]|nr:AAEL003337-PA [Aedes aegypti]
MLVQTKPASADFGLPMAVVGGTMITSSANSINTVINMMNMNLRRYSPVKQYGPLRSSSEKIAQMAQKVADLGKLLASNVTKAATDRVTPVTELFNALQGSYDQMSQYLKSDALVSVNSLDDALKTTELVNAFDGVTEAIANVTTITQAFQHAIGETLTAANGKPVTRSTVNTYIPPSLTISMANALGQLKEQTSVLSKAVEYMLKNIAVVDAHITKVNATALNLEQRLNATLLGIEQQYLAEADNIIRRLYTSQNNVKTEISNSVGKLSIFQSNRTLLNMVDGFSEAYTKLYYYLFNRNQTDTESIQQAYNEIISNMKQQVQSLNNNFTSEMQQTAITVGFQYLNRNANFNYCFVNHQNQIFSAFTVVNNAVNACLNREKTRLGRLPDVIDRFLRQTEANTEDFSFNIATCTSQSGFEKSAMIYMQAHSCLNTTLNHTEGFQQVIAQGYDTMLQMLRAEVAGNRFRLSDCLESRGNEGLALIEGLNQDVEKCLYGDGRRTSFADGEQEVQWDDTDGGEWSVTESSTEPNEDYLDGEHAEDLLGNY